MDTLYINGNAVPTNLHLRPGTTVKLVTADLWHIAERIREISDRLYILELEEESAEGQRFGLAIMEHTPDKGDFLVFRVAIGDLDARVLNRLKYMMSVPLQTRLAILDKEREKWEEEQRQNALDDAYERVGGPMLWQFQHDGFVDSKPQSFRPMGTIARRAGRKMDYDK